MNRQPLTGEDPSANTPASELVTDTAPHPSARRCPQCATLPMCVMSGLSDTVRNRLSPHVSERAFRKGEVLVREGRISQHVSVIKLGTVAVYRQGQSSQPQPVSMLGRGQLMGGYAVYGHAEPVGAVALSSGRICHVEVGDLYRLDILDRQFHTSMQQQIVRWHGYLADWARVMHIKNIQQRVLAALQLFTSEQRVRVIRLPGQSELATLLSTTRESVARSLQQLQSSGHILRHDRWHCEVVTSEATARGKLARQAG